MAKEYITVAVSLFYNGLGWLDKGTNITFLPTRTIAAVRIDKSKDLSGIYNAYRKNHLLLLEGAFDQKDMVEKATTTEETNAQFEKMAEELKAIKADAIDAQTFKTIKKEKEDLEKELTEIKGLFFKAHTFSADELKESFYTVDVLKEILGAKAIEFAEKDTKAVLRKKLVG